ncbi:imidazole glycerol phosphate synthase subunit HisF [Ornithinibacillus sp. 4-3]|uniref:Imidazole glycerol phosphate synthase subunit HisF n=1 Tax=Ornithinibacillus sp. 4-3 TaxID=3231488 RepID=A0AB39HSU3_9BACI
MRIIPCLDVDKGKVVKGKKFVDIQEIADPIVLAKKYVEDGADELVFYDITASTEDRELFLDTIQEIRKITPIPFMVGGGIKSLQDIENLIQIGVDKFSINSAAINNLDFIKQAAEQYGSERIILSMDVKKVGPGKWNVFAKGGQQDTGIDAIEWAVQGEQAGAGEVVLNSIDADGVKEGYDLELTRTIAEKINIPVIASGGAGKKEDFLLALTEGKATGALGASVFHYNELIISDIKDYISKQLNGAEEE